MTVFSSQRLTVVLLAAISQDNKLSLMLSGCVQKQRCSTLMLIQDGLTTNLSSSALNQKRGAGK